MVQKQIVQQQQSLDRFSTLLIYCESYVWSAGIQPQNVQLIFSLTILAQSPEFQQQLDFLSERQKNYFPSLIYANVIWCHMYKLACV